jgi:DNA-binding MarR family transcriptional regulator
MREDSPKVERFIRDEMDSVPHLEAVLLLWRTAPRVWSAAQLAEHLYISQADAAGIADDLHRRGLIARDADDSFFFDRSREELNALLESLDATYRRDLIRISGIIHSKASPGIRAFADAFRLRKDKS